MISLEHGSRGRPKSEEQIRRQSYVWERLLPFVKPELSVNEIAQHSGLKPGQVRNAVYRKRQWREVAYFSNPEKANRERSEAIKGKPKSPESILRRYYRWQQVEPFYSRGAEKRWIMLITGLSSNQVANAIQNNNEWPEGKRVQPFDDKSGLSRSQRAFKLREKLKQPFSEDQQKSLRFAQEMFRQGLIPKERIYWDKLHALGLNLPDSFTDKLNLEFFLKARIEMVKGNPELMNQYSTLGEKIDPDWFTAHLNSERRFIAELTRQPNLNGQHPNGRKWGDDEGYRVTLAEAAAGFKGLKGNWPH